MREPSLVRRLSVFYFLLYLPLGIQTPYLFLYFKRLGFSDAQLGTLAAVGPVMNFLAPPLWGMLADAWGDRRRMLTVLLAAGALATPWFIFAHSFAASMALLIFFSAFSMSPTPLADTIVLENIHRAGGDYGRLRLWGSIGFAVPLLVLGLVLKKGAGAPASSLYPIFIGFCLTRLLSVAWVRMLPASHGHAEKRLTLRGARELLHPAFVVVMSCALLANGAMSAYYLYFSIYLDTIGVGDSLKGYFWAVAVASETVMMLVIGRVIKRIGLKWTFALGIFGGAVRLFVFSTSLSPAGIACAQLLHALTLTAFMVSGITFVRKLTPPHLRATGQTMWAATTQGLGSAVGSKLSGLTVAAWGLLPMYRTFSLISACAVLLVVVLVREPKQEAGAPA